MYVEHREFDEAEKDFAVALRLEPRDELSLSWLGELASARARITITKYILFEQHEKALAARLIHLERRDASKVAAARGQAGQGDRMATVIDEWGIRWNLATHVQGA